MILIDNINNNRLKNIDYIDITVKNNPNHILAPTWELVMNLKKNIITWSNYRNEYIKILESRFKNNSSNFYLILNRSKKFDICLLCYCINEKRCHRIIAKEFLESIENRI